MCESNFQKYKYIPTHFTYALLSAHSYQDSENGAEVTFNDENLIKYNAYLKDWCVHSVFDKGSYGDDYYGALYLNPSWGHAVLAHRGTAIMKSLRLENESLKADLIEIFERKIGPQQRYCYEAVTKSQSIIKPYNYHFSTTGHSLGAWLAEDTVYYCHKPDINCTDIKAITFDSPGTLNQFEKHRHNIKNLDNKNIEELDITTYLSAPNIVNSCNQHVGLVYRLYPEIQYPESAITKLKAMLVIGNLIQYKKHYIDAFLSVSGHSLGPLIDCFDPASGKAKQIDKMLDWPYIKHTDEDVQTISLLGLLKLVLGSNTPTELFHVITSYLGGNTNLFQLFETYKYIDINVSASNEKSSKATDIENKFALTMQGHYEVQEYNPQDSMEKAASIEGSTAWILKQLDKSRESAIAKRIDNKQTCSRLNKLKQKFKLDTNKVVVKEEYRNSLTYDDIENEMKLLLEIPEVRNLNWHECTTDQAGSFKIYDSFFPQSTYEKSIYYDRKYLNKNISNCLKDDPYVVIKGVTGSGKSTLAAHYLDLHKEKDLVKYILADTKESIVASFKSIALASKIMPKEIIDDTSAEDLIGMVLKKMSEQANYTDSEVLLCFDGVQHQSDIQFCLNNLPENVKVIITTSNSNEFAGESEQDKFINLQPFNKNEVFSYLKAHLGERFNDEDLNKLTDTITGNTDSMMPYRIKNVLSWFKNKKFGTKVANYIELYNTGRTDEAETELLLDWLNESEDGEKSWFMLQHVAELSPDFIDESILAKIANVDLNILDGDSLDRIILPLCNKSIVECVINRNEAGIKLHATIQESVKRYAKAHKNESVLKIVETDKILNNLVEVFYELMPQVKAAPDNDWIKAQGLAHHIEHFIDTVNSDIIDVDTRVGLAKLCDKLSSYNLYVTNSYNKALEYAQTAPRLLPPESKEGIIYFYVKIGDIYDKLGNYKEALEYQEKAFGIFEDKFGNSSNSIDGLCAKILKNMAFQYKSLSNNGEALKYYKKSYEILNTLENKANFAKYIKNIESEIVTLEELGLKTQGNEIASTVDSIIPDDASIKDGTDAGILGEATPSDDM